MWALVVLASWCPVSIPPPDFAVFGLILYSVFLCRKLREHSLPWLQTTVIFKEVFLSLGPCYNSLLFLHLFTGIFFIYSIYVFLNKNLQEPKPGGLGGRDRLPYEARCAYVMDVSDPG